MPRRFIIIGIISTLLLATCGAAMVLISLAGWLFFPSAEPSQAIRIVPLAPMTTPVVRVAQELAVSPPGLIAAAMTQPLATATSTLTPSRPETLPHPTATATPTPLPQGIATRLVIPKLSLDTPVLFAPIVNGTWKVDHLAQTVGHLEATAPPGSNSNIVLAGHVTLATGGYGPFVSLSQLTPGDLVIVYEGDQKFFYVVENSQTVGKNNVEVTYPTNTGQITLLTCINWNSEEGRYSERFIVRGRLIKS